ncbi:MAG: M48 family metallopeptidase, partial [Planctomycetota bacterium]
MPITRRTVMPVLLLLLGLASCAEVPLTGRKQLAILSVGQMSSMSAEQYNKFLNENEVVTGTAEATMVQGVGARIQAAVERYFEERGQSHYLKDFDWRFELVKSDTVNAWCMPGGRVVVYTGMLPVAQDETGLAVVIGHEVSHAVARHGRERMSQNLVVVAGTIVLNEALSEKPEETRTLFLA